MYMATSLIFAIIFFLTVNGETLAQAVTGKSETMKEQKKANARGIKEMLEAARTGDFPMSKNF